MKLLVGIPLLLSVVSFVLTILALLAGHKEGFMEDYHVVLFNTSTLGHNFIQNLADGDFSASASSSSSSSTSTPTSTITSAASTSTSGFLGDIDPGGFFSSVEASATALVGSLESEAASILNDIGNDVADKLAQELGIEQFYSVHVMDLCQGYYEPNATSNGASLNITECSKPMNFSAMDVSDLLNKQLSLGPFNVTLSDLGVTDDMTGRLKDLPSVLKAIVAIYIISAVFTGLAVLGAFASLFILPAHAPRRTSLANLGLALPAAVFLLIGSLLYTIGAAQIVKELSEMGAGDIGLEVEIGTKFEALSWAAFALMVLATAYWLYEVVVAFRARKRAGGRRVRGKGEKHSTESSRSGNGRVRY